MNLHFARWRVVQTASSKTREGFSLTYSYSSLVWIALWVLFMVSLSLSTSCSSVQSSIEEIMTGEPPVDKTYAGRQHFPVTPTEAVECLIAIASKEGWQVVSTGEEYSTQGIQGRFFRIERIESVSNKPVLSGVFYAEPSGSYVRVSEQNGLPESLVEPLIAEIKKTKHDQ